LTIANRREIADTWSMGDRLMGEGAARRRVIVLSLATLMVTMLGAGSAQAAAGKARSIPAPVNYSGTYNGQIKQVVPKAYTGHIHFIVRRGKITRLRFTVGTMCGTMWAVDQDHALLSFLLKLKPTGAFAYKGTVAGRFVRLRGKITGNKAHGTFFQAFPLGALTCTMGQAAPFTVTRQA
jgi:hypothetical protein